VSVRSPCGAISGQAGRGFVRFLGIPFAAPPVGQLRFGRPKPHPEWKGTFEAHRFGPVAPQLPQPFGGLDQLLGTTRGPRWDEGRCLTLNVWTPGADGKARPVMVWIHGGGFNAGASSTPWYDGSRFATDCDVVLVSINYRLGSLGFCYLGELGVQDAASSGCLGILDQVEALRWVRNNIASFGGDPQNVTVFGESAGAMSVATLLGLKEAKGLFHKAILQSGAAANLHTRSRAALLAKELLELLGLKPGPELSDSLRKVPTSAILEAQGSLAGRHRREGLTFQPVVDGTTLSKPPLASIAQGAAADVPILIGTNLEEWKLFSVADPRAATMSLKELEARLAALWVPYPGAATDLDPGRGTSWLGEPPFPPDPRRIIEAYDQTLPGASPKAYWEAAMTDLVFRIPAIRLAEAHSQGGGRSFMYLFTWRSTSFEGALGSCHAVEIPFVFNTLGRPGTAMFVGDQAPAGLASSMNATWAAFARHGDPSLGDMGPWPAYEGDRRATMVIEASPAVVEDPMGAERRAWDGFAGPVGNALG